MNTLKLNSAGLNRVTLNTIGEVRFVSKPPIPTYTLSASVVNGVISATLNGVAVPLPYTAKEGDVIVVSVTPTDGYTFEGWSDGNTDNPRTITMSEDVDLSAECVEESKYIKFADAEVERVLMAKDVSSDGIGITKEDAERVTEMTSWFKGNTEITSFEELRYFSNVTKIKGYQFQGCSKLEKIDTSNITYIDSYCFENCSALQSVNLAKLIYLGIYSFSGCRALQSVGKFICGSVPTGCFQNCTSLNGFDFSNVTSIKQYAFYECKSLTSIELMKVSSIGQYAFRLCSALKKVICRMETPPTLGAGVFLNINDVSIYVPDASLEAYKAAENWSTYADRIKPISEIEA